MEPNWPSSKATLQKWKHIDRRPGFEKNQIQNCPKKATTIGKGEQENESGNVVGSKDACGSGLERHALSYSAQPQPEITNGNKTN